MAKIFEFRSFNLERAQTGGAGIASVSKVAERRSVVEFARGTMASWSCVLPAYVGPLSVTGMFNMAIGNKGNVAWQIECEALDPNEPKDILRNYYFDQPNIAAPAAVPSNLSHATSFSGPITFDGGAAPGKLLRVRLTLLSPPDTTALGNAFLHFMTLNDAV